MDSINVSNKLLSFIKACPSAFHTVSTVSKALDDNGFIRLSECDEWNIEQGGSYYVTRNQSSVIAFRIPNKKAPLPFMIAAAHSDSPSFKIKHDPESDTSGYIRINTEKYGGMLCSTWFDRPLSCAGRVTVIKDGKVKGTLVDLERDLFMIPSVAIHMNRNANEGATYNAAIDMQPICGSTATKGKFMSLIADACECDVESIASTELFLYPNQDGSVWGIDNEFISSPRLDDLQCVYSGLVAITSATPTDAIPMLMVSDNEEVGSSTKQGADSTFLHDTVARINRALGGNCDSLSRIIASSFMVSADNAHAIHPNHPEYADKCNAPIMNEGIVIKHSASQSYTTDAISAAIFESICKKADVPVQHFTNRSDMRGGSTLGNISSTQLSINTVDIGLPQLAMHSCYETAGVKDTEYLIKAITSLYESSVKANCDGDYEVI